MSSDPEVDLEARRISEYLSVPISRRKVFQIVGGTAAAAFLAACSSSTATQQPATAAPATPAPTAPPPATAASATAASATAAPATAAASATPVASAAASSASAAPSAAASASASAGAPSFPPVGIGSTVSGPNGTIYGDLYATLPKGTSAVIGLPGQVPKTLDPLKTPAFATFHSTDPAHDWLEHFDTTQRLVPSLATSVTIVDDTTLKYVLHDNIKFHNGRAVTSDDVKALFEWIQDPKNGSGVASRIEGVTVQPQDPKTFLLKLAAPNAGLRSNLTRVPIVPLEAADKQSTAPVGCGPYTFKEYVQDSHVDWVKNPNYWNPSAPLMDSVRVAFFPDTTSGSAAFLAGQLDYDHEIPRAQLSDFQSRQAQGQLTSIVTERGWVYIAFNHAIKPYDNPKVRNAIRLAVDRTAMAGAPYNGTARPLWFAGITPENPYYPKDLEYQRDVEMAKTLMKDAGLASGFSDTMLTLNFDYYQGVNQIAQQNLAEIGITLDLEVVDLATIIDRTFTKKDYHITSLGDSLDPEPSAQIDPYFSTKGGNNYFNYSNTQADTLMAQATSTFDDTKRRDTYHQLFELLFITDAAAVPVTTEPYLIAYSPKFNGEQFARSPNSRLNYPIAVKSA
jgi:peptide/nickel transport system substrate-binding protein